MSATTSALRSSLRRISSRTRHSSSSATASSSKTALSTTTTLPRKKLRALVSLYHQSDSFITPETLSKAIDDAFIYKTDSTLLSHEQSYWELEVALRLRQQLPSIGDADISLVDSGRRSRPSESGVGWSSQRTIRENQAVRALFGVEDYAKPGADVLLEEAERIQEFIKKDKEAQE